MGLEEYLPFWKDITKAQRDELTAASAVRSFKKGETIHRGGNDCIGLLIVTAGQLRAFLLSEEGKEVTLYRLFERDMCLFSASCMLPDIQFDVMVSAERDTDAILIPADRYKKLMEISAPVANYTSELMASHFSDVMWLVDQILNKKLDTRLAALLVEESELEGKAGLSVTHETLANHLGTIREVVTRLLKYFRNEGLVKLGRAEIVIKDSERLAALARASIR